jgi:hypothetical protein
MKPGKFEELKCILKSIPKTVHVILLTETWIKTEEDAKLVDLPNYDHMYNHRTDHRGGGVSIYVINTLTYKVTENLYLGGNNYLWIHLDKLSLDIGVIYKPGDTTLNPFLEVCSAQLEKRRRAIVIGDFNIDILKSNASTIAYKEMIEEAGYDILNKIDAKHCTRKTATTETILDHICSNLRDRNFHLAVIDSSLSDHNQLYLEVKKHVPIQKKTEQYEAIDYENLYKQLSSSKLTNISNEYSKLENYIISNVNRSKIIKKKIQNLPQDDWINKEIMTGITKRNILWKTLKNDPENEILKNAFKKERNKISIYNLGQK